MGCLDALAVDNSAGYNGLAFDCLPIQHQTDIIEWAETGNDASGCGTTSKLSTMDQNEPVASPSSSLNEQDHAAH